MISIHPISNSSAKSFKNKIFFIANAISFKHSNLLLIGLAGDWDVISPLSSSLEKN